MASAAPAAACRCSPRCVGPRRGRVSTPPAIACARPKSVLSPKRSTTSRHAGNDEAARVHRAYGRECRMAVRCEAQQPGRTYRLGLRVGECTAMPRIPRLFRRTSGPGFIVGQNLTVECRAMGTRRSHSATCGGAGQDTCRCHFSCRRCAVRAVQQATKTIPIIALTEDLVGPGLRNLASSARRQYNGR